MHETVSSLACRVSSDSIIFPIGRQLERTMRRFEQLCGLPMCCGAVDGTFVKIVKPDLYGDRYWCYKGYPAVILFACVDSRGLFTFVDVGAAGSIGDAAVYNYSVLKKNIDNGAWLNYRQWQVDQTTIRPFIIGDSAFALSSTLMRIFSDNGNLSPQQEAFNYSQILTRRVVECAFGRLKERFSMLNNW